MSKLADGVACGIKEFCGERTCTNTSAVGFHNTIYLTYAVRTDAKTGAGTGTDGVGRGDERIASEINIEHCALGTLAEDRLALAQQAVDLMFGINNME